MLRINEMDQPVVPTCELDSYEPANEFLRGLIEEAKENGEATQNDADGCPVTATVWDAEA